MNSKNESNTLRLVAASLVLSCVLIACGRPDHAVESSGGAGASAGAGLDSRSSALMSRGGLPGPRPVPGPNFVPMGPNPPAYFSVWAVNPRTPSFTISAGWYNQSSTTHAVLYRAPASFGPFSLVSTADGAFDQGSNSSMADPAPPVDTEACYQVVVSDAYGSAASSVACISTPDGRNRPLWRAQLQVGVSSVSDAGTDSSVHVQLNNPAGSPPPSGNNTWIDTPLDDFQAGSLRDYELLLNNLSDVSDVKGLSLLVDGDDALCVSSLVLSLNEQTAYWVDYGDAGCRWISSSSPLTITTAEMRASPAWSSMTDAPMHLPVPYEFVDGVVTATIGDALHGRGVSFSDESSPSVEQYAGTIRILTYGLSYYGLPLALQVQLQTKTYCDGDGHNKGQLYVGAVDVDATSWLWLVKPISEALVDAFSPSLPIPDAKTVDLGPCADDYHLCFIQNGVSVRTVSCN